MAKLEKGVKFVDIATTVRNAGDPYADFSAPRREANLIDDRVYYDGNNSNYSADPGWYESPPNPPFSNDFTNPVEDQEELDNLNSKREDALDYNKQMGIRGYLNDSKPMDEMGLVSMFEKVIENSMKILYKKMISDWFGNNADPSTSFKNSEQTLSPIVIDLVADGIETLSQSEYIYFDHDNNGMAEKTGWVANDDGLLVLDRNADGLINNGSELFGNNTLLADGSNADNGYDALQELDANSDGVIDANDDIYNELRVWQDSNSDGISQSEELLTLEEVGIASLNTEYTVTNLDDGNGNTIKQTSTATKTDGSTVDTADVWFGVNLTRTVETDILKLTENVQALPDATAFGSVRSLRQAMIRDQALADLVTQYTNADSTIERNAVLDELIYQWTGSADVDPYSRDPSKIYLITHDRQSRLCCI